MEKPETGSGLNSMFNVIRSCAIERLESSHVRNGAYMSKLSPRADKFLQSFFPPNVEHDSSYTKYALHPTLDLTHLSTQSHVFVCDFFIRITAPVSALPSIVLQLPHGHFCCFLGVGVDEIFLGPAEAIIGSYLARVGAKRGLDEGFLG